MPAKISVKTAAKVLGISELAVRIGMEYGTLPIGSVIRKPGNKRGQFHISPKLLSDYSGVSIEKIKEMENIAA